MHFKMVVLVCFVISMKCLAAAETPYISIQLNDGRYLFHSKKQGDFFSVGSNSFMESAANLKMKTAFKARSLKTIYEEQLQSYLAFGFNSLGGWSNTEYLQGRLPYSVILFDDDFFPRASPLKDCAGKLLPSGDAEPLPNPLGDPFDKNYVEAVKIYLRQTISAIAIDPNLMLY